LPHFFEKRLTLSNEPAQKYISQFPSTLTTILATCTAYVSGAVVGVLLLLTLSSDSSLLINLRLGDRALLWYLAIFSAVLALSRSFIPERGQDFRPAEIMEEVVKYTNYMPARWRNRSHTWQVHAEFGRMYKPRLLIFLDEIVSTLATPFILCFTLPQCAGAIIDFVKTTTINVKGVGQLCRLALELSGENLYSLRTSEKRKQPETVPKTYGSVQTS